MGARSVGKGKERIDGILTKMTTKMTMMMTTTGMKMQMKKMTTMEKKGIVTLRWKKVIGKGSVKRRERQKRKVPGKGRLLRNQGLKPNRKAKKRKKRNTERPGRPRVYGLVRERVGR
jgi:hypothetical protein